MQIDFSYIICLSANLIKYIYLYAFNDPLHIKNNDNRISNLDTGFTLFVEAARI